MVSNKSLIWTPGMNPRKRLYSLAPATVLLAGRQIALRYAALNVLAEFHAMLKVTVS
jgi:hypothetical protein